MLCIVNFEISHINSYIWLNHKLIIKIVDIFKNMRVSLKYTVEYLGIDFVPRVFLFQFNINSISYHKGTFLKLSCRMISL